MNCKHRKMEVCEPPEVMGTYARFSHGDDTLRQTSRNGSTPCQPAYPGKVVSESECGFQKEATKRGTRRASILEGFMFSVSSIDTATIQAYLKTDFHVHSEPSFILHVGEFCPELDTLCQRHGISASAYVTAYNPRSIAADEDFNTGRHGLLLRELESRGLRWMDGFGQHPSNDWPPEPSVLVLGISLDVAKDLGRQFEQNAILWIGPDTVPQLILLV
jgi:hypothetical protein